MSYNNNNQHGNQTNTRLGNSIPNPDDLSRRLRLQAAVDNNEFEDELSNSRSVLNSVAAGNFSSFWGSISPTSGSRSPVPLQCCCGREDCQNFVAFLKTTQSMEERLGLASEVGQALVLKQKNIEESHQELSQQYTFSQQKIQNLEDIIREFESTERSIIIERDDALRQKNILEKKNNSLTIALDTSENTVHSLKTEIEKRDNDIKRLLANNIKGERSEEREEMLRRQLEDLNQELLVTRKSELVTENKIKKLQGRFDSLLEAHEKLKKDQEDMKKSKGKLEAVAILRESKERTKQYQQSVDSNNEANSNLISLIKELNEVTSLQNRIEEMETASAAGFLYPGSYATTASIASPLNKNFPQNMDGDLYSEDISSPIHSSIPQNIITSFGEIEDEDNECLTDNRSDISESKRKRFEDYNSDSLLTCTDNESDQDTLEGVNNTARRKFKPKSKATSSKSLRGSISKKKDHSQKSRVSLLSAGLNMDGDLYSEDISSPIHSSIPQNIITSFGEIEDEDNECLTDNRSDISESKRKRFEDYNSDSLLTCTDNESDQDTLEGVNNTARRKFKPKSKATSSKSLRGSISKKKDHSQKSRVSLLSAGLMKSTESNYSDSTMQSDNENSKTLTKKSSSPLLGSKGSSTPLRRSPSAPSKSNAQRRGGAGNAPKGNSINSGGNATGSTSLQHKPAQSSPLALRNKNAQRSNNSNNRNNNASQSSNSTILKSKQMKSKTPLPTFKKSKFATLGPKERKLMLEAWRAGVANEQFDETVKGKSRRNHSNSPIKEFVEEVLLDEANLPAAEAAAVANEVENSLSVNVRAPLSSAALHPSSHHHHNSTMSGHDQESNLCTNNNNNNTSSSQQQKENPYQSLFNSCNHIMERFKGTDILALSKQLKKAFDILELTSLSNNLIENILADVETLKLYAFSPEDFLPLAHLFQDLLTEIGGLRKTFNDLQLTYVRKVEDTRRKAEEEFDRSTGYDDEIIERRQSNRMNQNNEVGGVFGTFSRVFDIQSQLRYHSRRMSVDYLHERDASVGSIDTFAEDSYFADRNYDPYSNVQNTARSTTKRRESNESTGGGEEEGSSSSGHNISSGSNNGKTIPQRNQRRNFSERSLLADISTTPIRSPSSTTLQYVGTNNVAPAAHNVGNLEDRLRKHLEAPILDDSLMKSVKDKINTWANPHFDGSYSDAKSQSTTFNQYKYTEKRSWVAEKSELDTLLGNIQTKLNTYQLQPYKAPDGLTLSDLDKVWQSLLLAETKRYKSIHNKLKDIKENLRKSFAQSANDFQKNLESISYSLVELDGELEIQLSTVKAISAKLGPLEKSLGQIQEIDARCQEANIEENDYTVFSVDDLKFELGLVQQAVTKKISFIENQIVSRNMTNLTPAQLEEFESTFRHFDKDSSNTLNLYEFKAALASLGIFYNEEELFSAFNQMCEGEPEATFEQFILYMVSFTEDKTTPDQLRSSFKAVASDKPFVTELDLKRSLLSTNVVSYLKETMPQRDDVADGYDYEKYLDKAVKKPLISDVNRKKRLYWCHARKNWSNEWDKIIFSDES
ncbi:10171_t:CDS:10, partial [Entrophospora sp. SA101]